MDKLENQMKEYENILENAKQFSVLNGFVSYAYKSISHHYNNKTDQDKSLKKGSLLNVYLLKDDASAIKYFRHKKELLDVQIALWKEELNDLLLSNKCYKRQLEIAQYIVQESKIFDSKLEKYLSISNYKIAFSHISPRLFAELGYNTVIIKSSAYRLGVRSTIREKFLKRGNGAMGEYYTNFSYPTNDTGIKPMLFSHPLGDKYEKSMNGEADTFLIKAPSEVLYQKKKNVREELGKKIVNREVMWYDDSTILWHPFVTNLVHTTDNPSEASLHYLMAYPEHQLMTRFMYPNPNLEKVLIK